MKIVALWLVVAAGLFCQFEVKPFSISVLDVTGAPIPQAKARFLSLERVFEMESAAAGKIQVNHFQPGIYDLEISASGFRSQTLPGIRLPDDSSRFPDVVLNVVNMTCGFPDTVKYGANGTGVQGLGGQVIDVDSGRGLKGVKIELTNTGLGHQKISVKSGPKGYFIFADLPAARYDVHSSYHGYRATDLKALVVPRENATTLIVNLARADRMYICQ